MRLEADIAGYEIRIKALEDFAIAEAENLRVAVLRAQADAVNLRFASLSALGKNVRTRLNAEVKLQQFLRDVANEAAWINIKSGHLPTDLGTDMAGVQSLQKKHHILEEAIKVCATRVTALLERGNGFEDLVEADATSVSSVSRDLMAGIEALRVSAANRQSLLEVSYTTQVYYSHTAEAGSWMDERLPQASSTDYGSHEAHAVALSMTHTAFQTDIEAFQKFVLNLREECSKCSLQSAAHNHDSAIMGDRQQIIESQYVALATATTQRALYLKYSVQLLQFSRERSEMDRWLLHRESHLLSTDIGKSRDEVDAILKRHVTFVNDLFTNQSRVQVLGETAVMRIQEGHNGATFFREARDALLDHWASIVERANDREAYLKTAQVFHSLMQDMEESKEWILSKNTVLEAPIGSDIESITDLEGRFRQLELEVSG